MRRIGIVVLLSIGILSCDTNLDPLSEPMVRISLTLVGTGSGTVQIEVPGDDSSSTCTLVEGTPDSGCTYSASFRIREEDPIDQLTITPDDDTTVESWGGDCASSNGSQQCAVNFTGRGDIVLSPTVAFSPLPAHSVTLSPNPVEITDVAIPAVVTATVFDVNDTEIDAGTLTWTIADETIATIVGNGATATITGVAAGTTEVTVTAAPATTSFTAGTATVNVSPAPGGTQVTLAPFIIVEDAVELDFNAVGDLFVANSGVSQGNAVSSVVRRVTVPGGVISDFGDETPDPDALIVDPTGSVASQAGAIIVGGSTNFTLDENRLTEIAPDGSTTTTLLEGSAPNLSNPSSFAFLPDESLIISNFGTNSLTRLYRDMSGLQIESFYQANGATTGMVSVDVHGGSVFAVTGSGRLAEVSLTGSELEQNAWTPVGAGLPSKIATDGFGSFGNRLLIVTDTGLLMALDAGTGAFERLGSFAFENPVFGMVVSADGVLYIAESVTGQIWTVTVTP